MKFHEIPRLIVCYFLIYKNFWIKQWYPLLKIILNIEIYNIWTLVILFSILKTGNICILHKMVKMFNNDISKGYSGYISHTITKPSFGYFRMTETPKTECLQLMKIVI